MKDLIFISQILVLLMNVVTFIYLLDKKINYKAIRVLVLITFTVGLIITFGQVTWFSVLFSFTPALSLLKINHDGNIGRNPKKSWFDFRRGKQSMEGMERGHKTLSE